MHFKRNLLTIAGRSARPGLFSGTIAGNGGFRNPALPRREDPGLDLSGQDYPVARIPEGRMAWAALKRHNQNVAAAEARAGCQLSSLLRDSRELTVLGTD
jgi:hypothetical protein